MLQIARVFASFSCWLMLSWTQQANQHPPNTRSAKLSLFESKLNTRVKRFATSGRTLVASLLGVAYQYELPIGIEYVNRDAATRPINLELRNESVREIFLAIIQQAPEYRVSLSDGIIDIYAPKAREDSSNLLNRVIKDFSVKELDTGYAGWRLFCQLTQAIEPAAVGFGSIATGQWGPLKVTIHRQNAAVYEILNTIVAQNGKAAWVVAASPGKTSRLQVGSLWQIYPLETSFENIVLNKLTSVGQQGLIR